MAGHDPARHAYEPRLDLPDCPPTPAHPSGTGKTLIARACAAQTNATFLKLAGTSLVQVRASLKLNYLPGPGSKSAEEAGRLGSSLSRNPP